MPQNQTIIESFESIGDRGYVVPFIPHLHSHVGGTIRHPEQIELTTPPPNHTTNKSYGTISGHGAMIWSRHVMRAR